MQLSADIKTSIDQSVLCWLATVSNDNMPNVSPKEIFTHYQSNSIIIANIASPQTVLNINQNTNVCVSFINILVQKGFQLKGKAKIVGPKDSEFKPLQSILTIMTEGKFPFATITKIDIETAKPILAPSYLFYTETTENEQIENAKKTYGF